MASVEVRSQEAWYVRHGVSDAKIPCALFGTPTDDRIALMRKIVAAVAAEASASRGRGRPPMAPAAGGRTADTAEIVAAALRAVLGTAVPLPVAPVAAVDVVPNDDGQVPTPAETVAWYLGSLRKGTRPTSLVDETVPQDPEEPGDDPCRVSWCSAPRQDLRERAL